MKVSIITITYNRRHLIGQTIKSVRDQAWDNFEHIIIDDGSTDDTENVVRQINDARLKYFKYPHSGNLSLLHNRGFGHASGDIIALLDSDDIWHKSKLETVMNRFKNDQAIDFITHNIQYFKDIGSPQKPYYNYESDFFGDMKTPAFTFKILPFPVIVFRKSVLAELNGMNENFRDGQQDFLLRAAAKYPIYFMAESLTFIRLHGQNTHQTIKNLPYYTNFYKTAVNLLANRKIGLALCAKGMFLNSRNLAKFLMKSKFNRRAKS